MNNLVSLPSHELHRYLGSRVVSDSKIEFCVWSPTVDCVRVHLEGRESEEPLALSKQEGGYHVGEIDCACAGTRYYYSFDGGPKRPDPASRFQPDGVHGPSQVVPCDFGWTDSLWQGVPSDSLVIYELHIGAFTEAGTFRSAAARLDELVDLGVTAIELMPVADCAGRWNWGYDGVCLFAPNRNYGTPDDLKLLINAAHAKGLAVILDVVYNHLGPEGNYLGESGPYLSSHHNTNWGAAPNFDHSEHGSGLRRFFIANAIHWLEDYHFDGLRVDAVHCMKDESDTHVLTEMSQVVRSWTAIAHRPVTLIAETNVFDPEISQPISEGGSGFDSQWCDDFLHSVFAIVRPGESLSHRRYESGSDLDQTMRRGYVHDGTLRQDWCRTLVGEPADVGALIYAIQNHDFVGNHPLGKRLHQLTSNETQRAAVALLLLHPATPMLFMGEEFCCDNPFQFFVDFSDVGLRDAVVKGRKREYPQHDWSNGRLPTDAAAYHDSKIGSALNGDCNMRSWYQDLLAYRKRWIASGILQPGKMHIESCIETGFFVLRYRATMGSVTVAVRLSNLPCDGDVYEFCAQGVLVMDSCPGQTRSLQLLPNHAKVFFENLV
ncbi:malto-oligosyltrehalose trehalohydrolase [bacterium]|jgi:maltooligosyltrehalose trehalohydrolase|nr:malto-oligosyltrehalose trehalohydrolase [bacterium]